MQTQQDGKNTLTPVLTKLGRELLARGVATKKNYRISHVALGTGKTKSDDTELRDQVGCVEVGGTEISDYHIHVSARIKSDGQHDVKEVGFYLSEVASAHKEKPVLFAWYSHEGDAPLLRTSPASDLLLSFDLLIPEDIKPITITDKALLFSKGNFLLISYP